MYVSTYFFIQPSDTWRRPANVGVGEAALAVGACVALAAALVVPSIVGAAGESLVVSGLGLLLLGSLTCRPSAFPGAGADVSRETFVRAVALLAVRGTTGRGCG